MTTQPEQETTAAAQAEPQNETERLAGELAEAQARNREIYESYVRSLAEADNLRKRSQRDVEAAHRYAIERFAGELLEVRDSLEMGLAAGQGSDPARLLEGMEATFRLLNKAFEKSGITVLDPVGEPFNPEFHEAMVTQPTTDHPDGSVMAVIQKGYVLNGRLLRPARVVIARAP